MSLATAVVFSLALLAFWRKDMFLYFIAGPAAIAFGFSWYRLYETPLGMVISLAMVALGFYMLVRGIMKFIETVK